MRNYFIKVTGDIKPLDPFYVISEIKVNIMTSVLWIQAILDL